MTDLTQHERAHMLTRTQRAALAHMQANPDRESQWPLGRGRFANYSTDSRWSAPTLQALVDAGLAEWRGSTYETPYQHGVMPHVKLTAAGRAHRL